MITLTELAAIAQSIELDQGYYIADEVGFRYNPDISTKPEPLSLEDSIDVVQMLRERDRTERLRIVKFEGASIIAVANYYDEV